MRGKTSTSQVFKDSSSTQTFRKRIPSEKVGLGKGTGEEKIEGGKPKAADPAGSRQKEHLIQVIRRS